MLIRVLLVTGLALLMAECSALAVAAGRSAKWTLGTPIVTYWAGPGTHMTVDQRTVEQLAAGGWNLGWAKNAEDLDTYHRCGVRAMLVINTPNVDDPVQAKALEDTIAKARNHPALYAYYIVDEPGAGAFPGLAKLVSYLRQRDPAHLAYINLLPTYASDAQLQVSNDAAEKAKVGYPQDFAGINTDDKTALRYREHLRQFVDVVKPDLISYDHYHFLKNSDGGQYFLNLSLIRSAALEAGKPFLNIVQSCDSPAEGWRGPGADELRWLTYTSLAYGAQGIAHFRYDIGMWKDPSNPETPLPLYWALSQINREFVAIAAELQPLRSLGAYHCGTMPLGGQPLPAKASFAPEPRSQEVLLGYFGRSDRQPTHVVVANLDYKKPVTTTLTGPGAMETFNPATKTWTPGGSKAKLNLLPGGGALVRLSGKLKMTH